MSTPIERNDRRERLNTFFTRKSVQSLRAGGSTPSTLVNCLLSRPLGRRERRVPMKSDVEKTIEARVGAAFEDVLAETGTGARDEILRAARDMVKTVWTGKIYAALPKDK